MKAILLLLRPHQWLKNLFIFLLLFFDPLSVGLARKLIL